jgi:hypothetical protein
MRRVLILLAALTALAAAPVAARAAPPWSPPQSLGAPHLFVDPVEVTASGDGTLLAWWRWQDGTGNGARTGWSAASRAPGAVSFGPERAAPDDLFGVVGYARTRTVAGVLRLLSPARETFRLAVRFGRASGSFGRARTIATAAGLRGPRLAANADGVAALAWFADRGTFNDRVYVSLRRPGGSFGSPIRIAEGRIRSVAVAVGSRGDVLVAWDERGTIRARYRRSPQARFAAAETIRSEDTYFAAIEAAVAESGRCYLAWSAQLLREGGGPGPVYYQVAVRPSGGRFRTAQLLERQGPDRTQAPIALATEGRSALVAWTGFDGANARARSAATDAGGRFGAPQDLSPPGTDASPTDVAAGGGSRVVIWDDGSFDANQVFAAFAPPGAGFGAPEAVSEAQEARRGRIVLAARPTVVWTNRPAGSGPPVRTVAQAATR